MNIYSGVHESGRRDEQAGMQVALEDRMVARERRCEYIFGA